MVVMDGFEERPRFPKVSDGNPSAALGQGRL